MANRLDTAIADYMERNPVDFTDDYSLPGTKESKVAAITEAKKKLLQPVYDKKTYTMAPDTVEDMDSVWIPDGKGGMIETRASYPPGSGKSLDAYEVAHPDDPNKELSPNKRAFQSISLAEELGILPTEVTDEMLYQRGEEQKQKFKEDMWEGQYGLKRPDLEVTDYGEKGDFERPLVGYTNPVTGKDLVDSYNNPVENAGYDAPYNAAQRYEDALTNPVGPNSVNKSFSEDMGSAFEKGSRQIGQAGWYVADYGSRFLAAPFEMLTGKDLPSLDEVFNLGSTLQEGIQKTQAEYSPQMAKAIANVEHANKTTEAKEAQKIEAKKKAGTYDPVIDEALRYFNEFVGSAKAYLDNPRAIAELGAASAPTFLAGGVVGKLGSSMAIRMASKKAGVPLVEFLGTKAGRTLQQKMATRANLGYVSLSEGLSNGSEARQHVLTMKEEDLLAGSPKYVRLLEEDMDPAAARSIIAYDAMDFTTAVSGIGAGLISKFTGASKYEGNLFNANSPFKDTLLGFAKGKTASAILNSHIAKAVGKTLKGVVPETLEEIGQETLGQAAQNVAEKITTNKDKDVGRGLGSSGAAGGLAGGATAGAMGAVTAMPDVVKATAGVAKVVTPRILQTAAGNIRSTVKDTAQGFKDRKNAAGDQITNPDNPAYEPEIAQRQEVKGFKDTKTTQERRTVLTRMTTHIAEQTKLIAAFTDDDPQGLQQAIEVRQGMVRNYAMMSKLVVAEEKATIQNAQATQEDKTAAEGHIAEDILGSQDWTLEELEELSAMPLSDAMSTTVEAVTEQVKVTDAAIERRQATAVKKYGVAKDKNQVRDEIMNTGNTDNEKRSIAQHTDTVKAAFVTRNETKIKQAVAEVLRFQQSQQVKIDKLTGAINEATGPNATGQPVDVSTGTWQFSVRPTMIPSAQEQLIQFQEEANILGSIVKSADAAARQNIHPDFDVTALVTGDGTRDRGNATQSPTTSTGGANPNQATNPPTGGVQAVDTREDMLTQIKAAFNALTPDERNALKPGMKSLVNALKGKGDRKLEDFPDASLQKSMGILGGVILARNGQGGAVTNEYNDSFYQSDAVNNPTVSSDYATSTDTPAQITKVKDGDSFAAGVAKAPRQKNKVFVNTSYCFATSANTANQLQASGLDGYVVPMEQRDFSGATQYDGLHKVAMVQVDGKMYIVDHPQRELFKPLIIPAFNAGVVQNENFEPYFIEFTEKNLMDKFGLTATAAQAQLLNMKNDFAISKRAGELARERLAQGSKETFSYLALNFENEAKREIGSVWDDFLVLFNKAKVEEKKRDKEFEASGQKVLSSNLPGEVVRDIDQYGSGMAAETFAEMMAEREEIRVLQETGEEVRVSAGPYFKKAEKKIAVYMEAKRANERASEEAAANGTKPADIVLEGAKEIDWSKIDLSTLEDLTENPDEVWTDQAFAQSLAEQKKLRDAWDRVDAPKAKVIWGKQRIAAHRKKIIAQQKAATKRKKKPHIPKSRLSAEEAKVRGLIGAAIDRQANGKKLSKADQTKVLHLEDALQDLVLSMMPMEDTSLEYQSELKRVWDIHRKLDALYGVPNAIEQDAFIDRGTLKYSLAHRPIQLTLNDIVRMPGKERMDNLRGLSNGLDKVTDTASGLSWLKANIDPSYLPFIDEIASMIPEITILEATTAQSQGNKQIINEWDNVANKTTTGFFIQKKNGDKFISLNFFDPHFRMDPSRAAIIMLHEFVHSVTSNIVEQALKNNPEVAQEIKDAVFGIETLITRARNQKVVPEVWAYAMSDLHETIAHYYSDPDFRSWLGNTTIDGKKDSPTFLQKIAEFIKKIFGLGKKEQNLLVALDKEMSTLLSSIRMNPGLQKYTDLRKQARSNVDAASDEQTTESLEEKGFGEPKEGFTLTGNGRAQQHLPKDQIKANQANAFIGYGRPGSSTFAYAEDALKAGVPVNTQGTIGPSTKAFVSVNGNATQERLDNTFKDAAAVIAAGGKVIMDNTANANREHNIEGEAIIQKRLKEAGYDLIEGAVANIFYDKKSERPVQDNPKSKKVRGILSELNDQRAHTGNATVLAGKGILRSKSGKNRSIFSYPNIVEKWRSLDLAGKGQLALELGLAPEDIVAFNQLMDNKGFHGFMVKFNQVFSQKTTEFFETDLAKRPINYFRTREGSSLEKSGHIPFHESLGQAMAAVAFHFLGSEGPGLMSNNLKEIGNVLQMDETKGEPHDLAVRAIQYVGTNRTALAQRLGDLVVGGQLHLTGAKDNDGILPAAIALSVGQELLSTMEKMGLITFNELYNGDIRYMKDLSEAKTDKDFSEIDMNDISYENSDGVGGRQRFVNISLRFEDTEHHGQMLRPHKNIQAISTISKAYKETVRKYLGAGTEIKPPSDTPIKAAPTHMAKDQLMETPKPHKWGINRQQKKPFGPNEAFYEFLRMDPETQLMIFGSKDPNKEHVTQRESQKARNENYANGIRNMIDHMALRGPDASMYMPLTIWKQTRIGEDSNVITPQNDKGHRNLFTDKSATYHIDITNDNNNQLLGLHVAIQAGFGVEPTKLGQAFVVWDFAQNVMRYDGTIVNDVNKAAVDAILLAKKEDRKYTKAENAAINAAVQQGGKQVHTYNALVTLANYSAARKDPKAKSVKVSIGNEVDGITNGPVAAAMQLAGTDASGRNMLRAGGILFDTDELVEYDKWYKGTTDGQRNLDNYEQVAKLAWDKIAEAAVEALPNIQNKTKFVKEREQHWIAKGKDRKKAWGIAQHEYRREANKLKAFKFFEMFFGAFPTFGPNNELLSIDPEAREMFKYPLMISAYGAGGLSIATATVNGRIEAIYERMAKAQEEAEQGKPASKVHIVKALQYLDIQIDMNSNLREFVFSTNKSNNYTESDSARMKTLFRDNLAPQGWSAINEMQGTVIDRKDMINQASQAMNDLALILYRRRLAAAEEAKRKRLKLKPGTPVHLSPEELRELRLKMRDAGELVTVKTANSTKLKNEYADSMLAMKTGKQFVSQEDGGRMQTSPQGGYTSNKFVVDRSAGTISISSGTEKHMSDSVQYFDFIDDLQVAPFTWYNLSFDGSVQGRLMQEFDMTNIHDAHIVGFKDSYAAALATNRIFFELAQEWSSSQAVEDTFTRLMQKVHSKLTPAEAEALDITVNINTNEDFSSIEGLFESYKVQNASIQEDRKANFAAMRLINQFPFKGAAHLVNGATVDLLNDMAHAIYLEEDMSKPLLTIKNNSEIVIRMPAEDNMQEFYDFLDKHNVAADLEGSGYTMDQVRAYFDTPNAAAAFLARYGFEAVNAKGMTNKPALGLRVLQVTNFATPNSMKKTVKDILGSIETDNANIAQKIADLEIQRRTDLDPQNANRIFEDLATATNVREEPGHTEYLRNLLGTILAPGLSALKTFTLNHGMDSTADQDNWGAIDGDQIYIASAEGNILLGMNMSMQEVYVHELAHGISKEVINSNPKIGRELKRLFLEAERVITVEDFLERQEDANDPDHMAAAKKRWKHVFDNKKGYLHEFFAYGLTNKNFRKALAAKVPFKQQRDIYTGSFLNRIGQLFMKMVDWIGDTVYKRKGMNAAEAIKRMARDITKINMGQQSKLDEVWEKFQGFNAPLRQAMSKHIGKPWLQYAARKNAAPSASGLKRILTQISVIVPNLYTRAYREKVNDLAYGLGWTMDSFVYQTLNEFAGIDTITRPYQTLLRHVKMFGDNAREDEFQNAVRDFMGYFIDEGLNITEDDWEALNAGMTKTNLSILLEAGNHTMYDIVNYLKDGRSLKGAIQTLENKIRAQYSSNADYYLFQSPSLGHYMARGEFGGARPMKNSWNIVTMLQTGTSPGNIDFEAAEQLVAELTSLHAISYTKKAKRLTTARMIETEYGANPDINGISYMLSAHKDFKKRSLEINFDGNKRQTVEGWTHEILDQYRAVKIAPIADESVLRKDGYVLMDPLSRDTYDRTEHNRNLGIYVTDNNPAVRRVTGIISYTGERAKGHGFMDIGLQQGLDPKEAGKQAYEETRDYSARTQSLVDQQIAGQATLDFENNWLAPTYNPHGQVVDYRYTMSEKNKIKYLNKQDQAHVVMGRMFASILDKQSTKKRNKILIKMAFEDFKLNFTDDPRAFVVIGPDSEDPKYREFHRLLPEDTKAEIRKMWGQDNFSIRADVILPTFGFQKLSLIDWFEKHVIPLPKLLKITSRMAADTFFEVVGYAKRGVIILLPSVVINNTLSNNLLLLWLGVPPNELRKGQLTAMEEIWEYKKLSKEAGKLERRIRLIGSKIDVPKAQRRLNRLRADLKRNPVQALITEGVFQNIVEDVELEQQSRILKNLTGAHPKVREYAKKLDGKMHPKVKGAFKEAIIAPGTELSDVLTKVTQYSDFVARYTLIKHRMRKDGLVLGKDAIPTKHLEEALEAFIEYDIPTTPQMQWMNDAGTWIYTKFFMRIQRVLARNILQRPTGFATQQLMQMMIHEYPDIFDSNALAYSNWNVDLFSAGDRIEEALRTNLYTTIMNGGEAVGAF